ncbi:MAG: hypothetical protein H0U49_09665 [Parachlamydiaceae bacterium]|nr:hypothetical protein [Parachlamydiaceae bacterium]
MKKDNKMKEKEMYGVPPLSERISNSTKEALSKNSEPEKKNKNKMKTQSNKDTSLNKLGSETIKTKMEVNKSTGKGKVEEFSESKHALKETNFAYKSKAHSAMEEKESLVKIKGSLEDDLRKQLDKEPNKQNNFEIKDIKGTLERVEKQITELDKKIDLSKPVLLSQIEDLGFKENDLNYDLEGAKQRLEFYSNKSQASGNSKPNILSKVKETKKEISSMENELKKVKISMAEAKENLKLFEGDT